VAIDLDKVDEVTMALLKLTSFTEHGFTACWKSHSWEVMNRLHQKGWIQNPVGKAKSVALTAEGIRQADVLFKKHFGVEGDTK
jgi:hypothetical protein